MTVWQKALAAATTLFGVAPRNGPPPAPGPEARPLPNPLRGVGRDVLPVHLRGPVRAPAARRVVPATTEDFVWPPVDELMVVTPAPRTVAAPPPRGQRERRRKRSDRRKRDRRTVNLGSPYGTERRSGEDDRKGDRRETPAGPRHDAGIGLARDYFSQVEARVTTTDPGLPGGRLIRFHD